MEVRQPYTCQVRRMCLGHTPSAARIRAAQDHRPTQMMAVSSLSMCSSIADVFVIIAPPAVHMDSGRSCNIDTYNLRGCGFLVSLSADIPAGNRIFPDSLLVSTVTGRSCYR